MGNLKFDAANHYFSGQGVVMIGTRDAVTGNPQGLRPVGNVSDLKVTIATTVIDHKGSQDGQRAIDKRLQTETKATASVTIENWNAKNLAKALRGQDQVIPAGTVAAETVNGYFGLVSSFKYIKVSGVSVKLGATALTEYVDNVTPYDYKLNEDAGSIMLNDPNTTGIALVTLSETGASVTAVAVGVSTVLTTTVAAGTKVGDQVVLSGFAGADAGSINGLTADITAVTGTTITVAVNTLGKTITGGSAQFIDSPQVLTVAYSYAAQYKVDSLTKPLTDNWIRFEGLNTVEGNDPVVVDIFRFSNDPLKELALISDTFGQFVLEGAVLNDNTRPSGSSPYFSVKKLN